MKGSRTVALWFFIPEVALGFLLVFSACVPGKARAIEIPRAGGTYRRPLEFSPRTLDPALATDIYSVTLIQQIFDGLVQYDGDLNVMPALARSWKISADGLAYTFHLREGVKFHNGREMTAHDWVYSLTRVVDPRTKSPAASFLDRIVGFTDFQEGRAAEVKGLRVGGKYILEIRLSEAYAPFLTLLGMNKFKVVPKEEIERLGTSFGKSPVGTGPFRFISMKEGEEILLEANERYFEGKPHLARILFKIYHGAPRERILKEFQEGNLEESFVPPDDLEQVICGRRCTFVQKPILSLRFYGFNLAFKPLSHLNFRKAINAAIDKGAIISEIHKNQFQLAKSILPPGMPGYDPRKNPYPFDPANARQLLESLGYPEGKNLLPLEIWSASDSDAAQRELNEVRTKLSNVGIQVIIRYEPNWPKFASLLAARKMPTFIRAWYADFPDPDNFLGTLFHSRSKYNYMAYKNEDVDRLLDQAKSERDYLKRMEMYRRIEEVVLQEAPIVPMVHNLLQMVFQPYVRGLEVNALGTPYIPMKKIWLERE